MTQRDYEFVKVFAGGTARSGFSIHCSRCPEEATFVQHRGTRRPPDAATQYFRNRGWHIGQRPNGDLCPACVAARRHLKVVPTPQEEPVKTDRFKDTSMLSSREEATLIALTKEPNTLHVDPPPVMDRDSRRLITDKLDSVYEKDSYVVGWSDSRVARELGCAKAWVSQVRDQFFGPEGSNPEIDTFLERLDGLMVVAKKHVADATQQSDALQKIAAGIESKLAAAQGLVRAVTDLTHRVSELEQLGAKLKKEAGK